MLYGIDVAARGDVRFSLSTFRLSPYSRLRIVMHMDVHSKIFCTAFPMKAPPSAWKLTFSSLQLGRLDPSCPTGSISRHVVLNWIENLFRTCLPGIDLDTDPLLRLVCPNLAPAERRTEDKQPDMQISGKGDELRDRDRVYL